MRKFIILWTLIVLSFLNIQAENRKYKVKDSFYEKGYSEIFTIDDNGIFASKVFNFPGESVEQLKNKVGRYFNNRIERRLNDTDVNSENSSFVENTLFVSESTPWLKTTFMTYAYARYTYKIEIKDGKIRATIYLNSWYWGKNFPSLSAFELYPFKSGIGFEKAFKNFYEYVKSILESLPNELNKDNLQTIDDNW